MNRPSAKHEVVQAALRLAGRVGTRALTFEAVAEAAGKTKGGVLYHFPSKDDLIEAVIAELIGAWDADALRHLGKPFETATREERIVAFLLAATESGTEFDATADLMVMVDVARDERYVRRWRELRDRWVGDVADLTVRQQVALVAADGIWLDEATLQAPFPAERRREVLEELARMVREG
ncbi:TetR/AcrR family transcriptional regulator [Microbacterium sp. Marseille-Q6965]|uniref:TetR/AcrR family transcriptional regulator n=1 Tax=Microbacterium sp. Marseille-Q6965 TaxID=2965072 RepID=UPI0021B82CAD|nr:TetR/AcrR family transcriptional regulator [Microbacterium sp. Marseille-Q6965]